MTLRQLGVVVGSISLPAIVVFAAQTTRQYGPFASGSPDSGTCGNMWAQDTFDRYFRVDTRQRDDGTYEIVQQFKKGTFVSNAGSSPGGCEGGNQNPPQIQAGIRGMMQGQFWIRVSGGTYNPNANPTNVQTTAEFVDAVFGDSATFEVYSFSLNYNAGRRGDWRNASKDRGGNHGDIR